MRRYAKNSPKHSNQGTHQRRNERMRRQIPSGRNRQHRDTPIDILILQYLDANCHATREELRRAARLKTTQAVDYYTNKLKHKNRLRREEYWVVMEAIDD